MAKSSQLKAWRRRRTRPLSYAVAIEYNLYVCRGTMGSPLFWILPPKFRFKHMFKKYFIRIPATFCGHLCRWSQTLWFHIRRIWTPCYLSFLKSTFSSAFFLTADPHFLFRSTSFSLTYYPFSWRQFDLLDGWDLRRKNIKNKIVNVGSIDFL